MVCSIGRQIRSFAGFRRNWHEVIFSLMPSSRLGMFKGIPSHMPGAFYAPLAIIKIILRKGKRVMKEETQSVHKCKFCNSDATIKNMFFVGTKPVEAEGFIKWDYFGETVYTCDIHLLSHDKRDINGGIISE